MKDSPVSGPHFYRLRFASQMIVWATRKRLHLLACGADDSKVAEAFCLAGLEDLYTGLMSIVDVLLCGASSRIQLHELACPCLSRHEISLLNALAHLQNDRDEEARRCMGDLLCPAAVRLVLPAMCAIVGHLDAQALRLSLIDTLPAANVPLDLSSTAIH